MLSILSELKKSKGIGIDISSKAIKIANENSKKHKLTQRTKFYRRSLRAKIIKKEYISESLILSDLDLSYLHHNSSLLM